MAQRFLLACFFPVSSPPDPSSYGSQRLRPAGLCTGAEEGRESGLGPNILRRQAITQNRLGCFTKVGLLCSGFLPSQ